jgi:hypothetical protein
MGNTSQGIQINNALIKHQISCQLHYILVVRKKYNYTNLFYLKSVSVLHNHIASQVVVTIDLFFALEDESAIVCCFLLNQETTTISRVKTLHVVDFLPSIKPPI